MSLKSQSLTAVAYYILRAMAFIAIAVLVTGYFTENPFAPVFLVTLIIFLAVDGLIYRGMTTYEALKINQEIILLQNSLKNKETK